MDLNEMIPKLKLAQEEYNKHKEMEKEVIQEEKKVLRKFLKEIESFSVKKEINGETAVLIYVYPTPEGEIIDKTFVHSHVYLLESDFVAYRVLNYDMYIQAQPDVDVIDGWAIKPLEDFLEVKPFYEILLYFNRRISFLEEKTQENSEKRAKRKEILDLFYKDMK